MKKIEKITIKLVMLLMFFSLLFPVRTFGAEKNEVTEKKQIIFLLDASKSMQGDGQWIEAADSACMIASALPKEYEVALLVYNTEIVYEEDFGNINQKTRHALETVELQCYTTPAVALETAADIDVYKRQELHLSVSTVKRAISDLEENGFIRKKQRWRDNGGRSSLLFEIIR